MLLIRQFGHFWQCSPKRLLLSPVFPLKSSIIQKKSEEPWLVNAAIDRQALCPITFQHCLKKKTYLRFKMYVGNKSAGRWNHCICSIALDALGKFNCNSVSEASQFYTVQQRKAPKVQHKGIEGIESCARVSVPLQCFHAPCRHGRAAKGRRGQRISRESE